jgi:hypothetical protein
LKEKLHYYLVVSLIFAVAGLGRCAEGQERALSGNQSLVVYDANNQPVRRIANVPFSTTCSNSGDALFAFVDSHSKTLLVSDQTGTVARSVDLHWPISQVVGDQEGFVVVHSDGHVSDVGMDGVRRNFLTGRQVVWAVRRPSGGVLTVTSGGSLLAWSWSGDELARYDSGVAGRAVALKGLAPLKGGGVVSFDSVSKELVFLDQELHEVRRAQLSVNELGVFNSAGSKVIVSDKGSPIINLIGEDGSKISLKAAVEPFCAGSLSNGSFYIGYTSKDLVGIPTGAYLRSHLGPSFTSTCLAAVVVASLLFASLTGLAAQRATRGKHSNVLVDEQRLSEPSHVHSETSSASTSVLTLALLLPALVGLYLAHWVSPSLRSDGSLLDWAYYLGGSLLTAGSFILIFRRIEAPSWSRAPRPPNAPWRSNRVIWTLLLGSVITGIITHQLNWRGGEPKLVVALWIISQVWFVMAFISSVGISTLTCVEWIHVSLLGAVGLISRVVKMGECPADISFDFGVAADVAYRSVFEEWNPLFILDAGQTIGRVWGLQLGLAIWGLGLHEWVLCVPSLIWALGFIFASYLLGRELISHRFGLIFGVLVALQHNLLSYSRLPYVTESTAPFIFCLYYLVRGFNACRMRDWAWAGVWASVSMMTVRQFTTFPFIGLALFLFMVVFHSRVMWRFRYHCLALIGGCLVTFNPWDSFYLNGQQLAYRLSGTSPLLWGYKVNPDITIWISQFDRAFGGILRYPDRISWPSEALAPICLAITGSLFGAGLFYLLYRWRSLSAPTALIPMAGSIALGSAFLDNPPSYYHQFVGILFVMFVVAVPLELLSEVSRHVRWRFIRWGLAVGIGSLVAMSSYEQLSPFLRYCATAVNAEGKSVPKYSIQSFFSRYMLEHHDRRFVGVASADKPLEWGHPNISIFYGQFSERHEIHSPVSSYLPLRATVEPHDVDFILRADNVDGLAAVKKVYPSGTESQELAAYGQVTLVIYTVPYSEVLRIYEASLSSGDGFDRAYFSLSPAT